MHHIKITCNIAKKASSAYNGDRVMEFGLHGGGEDGEYNHVSFVEIFEITVTYDAFFFEATSFDGV